MAAPAGFNLTFDDEFDSLSLNNGSGGTWSPFFNYSPNGSTGGGTSSWQVNPFYGPTSGGDANVFSDNNGVLSIGIKPTPASVSGAVNNTPFLAGQLMTNNSFSQTYGYFEMNAKLSNAPGSEAAFWMLPADGSWPPELDGAEVLGNSPSTLVMTAHSKTNGTTPHWTAIPDSSKGFHTYGVDWEPDKITWYFDDKQVMQQDTPADMNKPMYMMLSTLTGTSSTWVGAPNAGETGGMDVKFVHAYSSNPNARSVNSNAAPAAQPATPSPTASNLDLYLSEDAWQGNAQFSVAIDGNTIGGAQSVNALHSDGGSQDFSYSNALTAGTHDVAISFLNDAYGATPGADRNLYVNGISVDGSPVSGAAAAILTTSTQHFTVNIPLQG